MRQVYRPNRRVSTLRLMPLYELSLVRPHRNRYPGDFRRYFAQQLWKRLQCQIRPLLLLQPTDFPEHSAFAPCAKTVRVLTPR